MGHIFFWGGDKNVELVMIVVQFELNLTALASPETVTFLICNNRNKGGCVVFWPQLAESYPTRD